MSKKSTRKDSPTPQQRVGVSFHWVADAEKRMRASKVSYYLLMAIWPIVVVLGLPMLFDSMAFVLLGLVMMTMAGICRLSIVENENHIEAAKRLDRLESLFCEMMEAIRIAASEEVSEEEQKSN